MSRLTKDLHPFLTAEVLNELFKKSIYTTASFIRKKPVLLSNITGLHYDQILKIYDKILSKHSSILKRGDKYYLEILNHCALISSGMQKFDDLLDGGFMTGNIYELCGFEASGKTQTCMTVALNICTSTPHQVLFIDTKYDVSAQRLYNMLSNRHVSNIGEIMQKIKICHPTTASRLLNDLHHLKAALSEAQEKYLGFKTIIIDSLSVLFQTFCNLTESLSILNSIANIMNYLVSEYYLVILVTNFVTLWTSESTVGESENEEFMNILKVESPALGKYWAHVPGTRIMIRKRGCIDECYFTVLKSPNQPIGKSVKLEISNAGVS